VATITAEETAQKMVLWSYREARDMAKSWVLSPISERNIRAKAIPRTGRSIDPEYS
jgi:hypothetical protein